jgi:hypothetical protein
MQDTAPLLPKDKLELLRRMSRVDHLNAVPPSATRHEPIRAVPTVSSKLLGNQRADGSSRSSEDLGLQPGRTKEAIKTPYSRQQ